MMCVYIYIIMYTSVLQSLPTVSIIGIYNELPSGPSGKQSWQRKDLHDKVKPLRKELFAMFFLPKGTLVKIVKWTTSISGIFHGFPTV